MNSVGKIIYSKIFRKQVACPVVENKLTQFSPAFPMFTKEVQHYNDF